MKIALFAVLFVMNVILAVVNFQSAKRVNKSFNIPAILWTIASIGWGVNLIMAISDAVN